MTDKLCPGCPGDPNENCCKPELRVQVWRQKQQAALQSQPEAALPELPDPSFTYERHPGGFSEPERIGAYTADQMRAYALAALQSQPAALSEPALLGAIARGWCHPKNSGKEVDADLAAAIASEILAINPEQPAAAGVSDAEIERIFKECGGQWNGDQWVIEDADFHPAIREFLALRPQSESKTYADGTTATGTAPLPDVSPAEQDASLAESLLTDLESMLGGRNGASIKLRSLIRSLRPQAAPMTDERLRHDFERMLTMLDLIDARLQRGPEWKPGQTIGMGRLILGKDCYRVTEHMWPTQPAAQATQQAAGEPVGRCLTEEEQARTTLRDPVVWFGGAPRGKTLFTHPAPGVPEAVVGLVRFMETAFVPMTPQQGEIMKSLALASASLAAAQAKGAGHA